MIGKTLIEQDLYFYNEEINIFKAIRMDEDYLVLAYFREEIIDPDDNITSISYEVNVVYQLLNTDLEKQGESFNIWPITV